MQLAGSASQEDLPGTVSAQVDIPAGIAVSALAFTLTEPNGFTRSSTLALQGAGPTFTFVIPDVPARKPRYTLEGFGKSSGDRTTSCAGDVAFAVLPGLQTFVAVNADCTRSREPATRSPSPSEVIGPRGVVVAANAARSARVHGAGARSAGRVSVLVVVPAGVSVSILDVELSGPNDLDVKNRLMVTGPSPQFSFENVAPAKGDSIGLTARSTDGTAICKASSTFDILPGQTTDTTILLVCQAPWGCLA